MIYLIKILALIFGSVLLQTTIIARISIFGSSPDLPLSLVLALALFKGAFHGEVTGFLTGILSDAFSGGLLGLQAFSKFITGLCVGFLRGRLYSDNVITQFAAGFIGTVLSKLLESVYLTIFVDSQYLLNYRLPGLAVVAVINAFMVSVVFWLLKRIIQDQK